MSKTAGANSRARLRQVALGVPREDVVVAEIAVEAFRFAIAAVMEGFSHNNHRLMKAGLITLDQLQSSEPRLEM